MKNCDENTKLDDSCATNKKNVPVRKEDFCTEESFQISFFSKLSL